jgi:uncharacterized protein involved in high-affinity Fe2+ transport
MRHWNLTQEKLYQSYVRLGEKLENHGEMHQENMLRINRNWERLTHQGIWQLPVDKKYEGIGLSWSESIIAIEGLIKTHRNQKFFSSMISHLAVVYILLQHGTEVQKRNYLPMLMQGKISSIFFSDDVGESFNKLNITISKNINVSISVKENKYIFDDFRNFLQIIYGAFASVSAFYIVNKYKEILSKHQSNIFNLSVRKKCKEAENNIQKSRQKFILLFSMLLKKSDEKHIIDSLKNKKILMNSVK